MKYLVFIRHSLAQNGSFAISDFERALTPQGIARAVKQAGALKAYGILPDALVSSSAPRAMQTAQVFADAFSLSAIEKVALLYNELTTDEFLEMLKGMNESLQTVLIVGHNPTLSTLAQRLAPKFSFVFEPAALAVIRFDLETWSQIECGEGVLEKVINP